MMGTRRSRLAVLLTLLGGLLTVEAAGAAEALEELFVANRNLNSITVYRRAAGGNVLPLRTLSGPATGLGGPRALVVDLKNYELIVANEIANTITVYSLDATGNAAPLRTLSGPAPPFPGATGLGAPVALALDYTHLEGGPGVGALYVVNELGNSVTVYLWPNAGNAAPIRTLSGPATGLDLPRGIALDLRYDEMLVSSIGGGSAIFVYSLTANGNAAPLRALAGPATGLSNPQQLVIDYTNLTGGPGVGELLVANIANDTVTAYLWPNAGNAAPIRTLGGAFSGLSGPRGLAVDLTHNELFLTNLDGVVTVHDRNADGNTGPLRTLNGPATGLGNIVGLAVTSSAIALDRDFNGDGKSDILLRNASGELAVWLMSGVTVVGPAVLGTLPLDWTVAGSGDFNGDRKADILVRHASGAVAVVLMNGTTIASAAVVGSLPTDWTIERVGDFNGDAKADVLWRHTSGALFVWFLDGARVVATGSPPTLGTDWNIQ
jgi:hypothetical protein